MCRRAICIYTSQSIYVGGREHDAAAFTWRRMCYRTNLYKRRRRHKHGGMHKVWGNRFHSQSISAGVTFAYVYRTHIYILVPGGPARTLSFRLFIALCLSDPLLALHFCGGCLKWGYREWVVVWYWSKNLCSGCVCIYKIYMDTYNWRYSLRNGE